MVLPLPSFSGVPSGTSAVLDMTADFAPFMQAGLIVGLCILLLTVAIGIYDTWWEPRKAQKTTARSTPELDLPEAA